MELMRERVSTLSSVASMPGSLSPEDYQSRGRYQLTYSTEDKAMLSDMCLTISMSIRCYILSMLLGMARTQLCC